MLRRIRILGFKSLRDVEFDLAPLVVLFGPNTAGKSNLLEALHVLSRLVTERSLADAFGEPFRGLPQEAFTFPEGGLQGLLERDSASFELEADIQPGQSGRRTLDALRYRVRVSTTPTKGTMGLADEFLTRLDRDRNPKGTPRIERVGDHILARQNRRAGRPPGVSPGIGYTLASYAPHTGERYLDFDRLRAELAGWRVYYLDPGEAMRAQQPPREVDDIGSRGTWIAPLLYRWKETDDLKKHFRAVGRALRSAIPSVTSLDVDLDRRRGILDVQVCQDGTPYSSRVISEGTLRILALCTIAANPAPSSLVAFEEPENGVHPSRLDVIADLLHHMVTQQRRQIVVTTHSPAFVARMWEKQQENPGSVLLLRCYREGKDTGFSPFQSIGELFRDSEIGEALKGDERAWLFEEMLRRGWLDGR